MPKLKDCVMTEFRERNTFHALLLDDLRELVDEGIDEDNTRWVHAIVQQLCINLQREFAVEEELGYLEEVLERFPNWQQRVERLQRNRLALVEELKQLHGQLDATRPDTRITVRLREKFQRWIARLTTHKQQENILLMDAVNLDVGEGE